MLNRSEKNYIHVYMDLSDEILYFTSTSVPCRLGKSLLDFIYADLTEKRMQPESIREIHPFFSLWSDERIEALMNSDGSESTANLSFQEVRELQKIYTGLLAGLVQNNTDLNEDTIHYFLRHPFYSSGTLVNQTVKNENRWMIDYFVMSFEDCLMCELMEMFRRHLHIKTCKNCGRFFIPRRSNIDYCSRVYSEDGKTCTDVGYTKTFAKAVQKDDLLQAYTRAYKAHYARMTKPRKKAVNMTRAEFEEWHKKAKQGLQMSRQGKVDPELYKEWLKQ